MAKVKNKFFSAVIPVFILAVLIVVVVFFISKNPKVDQEKITSSPAVNPIISVDNAIGAAGSLVNLGVSFTAGTIPAASFQFDLTIPSGLSYDSISPASIVDKNVQANLIGNKLRVIVFGLNQTIIPTGQIATIKLKIIPKTHPGVLDITLSGIVVSSPSATAINTLGSSGKVTVR